MATIPFPLTARNIDELKLQVFELIRNIYEEKIGGAEIGDVFIIDGDVLTLNTGYCLEKTSNILEVLPNPAGGLQTGASGLLVYVKDTGGLEVDSNGVAVKCKTDGNLASDSDGLYVTGVSSLNGTKTWNPGAVADGGTATTTVTVTGAAVGDPAVAGFAGLDEAGWIITAFVQAANTVSVTIENVSGGVLIPAQGTLTARVFT